jgi:hypothetical protein
MKTKPQINADERRYLLFGFIERKEKVFVFSSIIRKKNTQVNRNHGSHLTSYNLRKILQMKAVTYITNLRLSAFICG